MRITIEVDEKTGAVTPVAATAETTAAIDAGAPSGALLQTVESTTSGEVETSRVEGLTAAGVIDAGPPPQELYEAIEGAASAVTEGGNGITAEVVDAGGPPPAAM